MKNQEKIDTLMANYKIKCKCGHVVIITPSCHRNKVLCKWCGNFVYKDKKTEFEVKLQNILKREQK